MWEMFKTAATGFLTGKLFSNPGTAYGMLALGILITALLFLGGWKIGLSLPIAAALAALLGGGLQPVLFKNLKFR